MKQQINYLIGTGLCRQFMPNMLPLILFFSIICSSFIHQAQASGVFELELVELQKLDQPIFTKQTRHQPHSQQINTNGHHQATRLFICLKEAFTSQLDGPCTFGNATLTLGNDNETNPARRFTVTGQEQQVAVNTTIEQDEQQASEARGSHLQSQNQTQFNQQHQQRSPLTNVVRILFTFRWTKSFTIILSAEQINEAHEAHQDNDRQQIIQQRRANIQANSTATATATTTTTTNRTAESRQQVVVSFADRHVLTENEVLPNLETNPNKPWTSRFSRSLKSSLIYRFRVFCSLNYYGDGCTTFCRARDDQFGHYNCSSTGQKVCLDGWQGADCDRARCRAGCNQQHGFCDRPDTCQCRPGWTGARCDECITYPGCQNGYCLSPWQCICQQNWGGVLCDQDLNYCGTREPCKNNATCQNVAPGRYRCDCPEGFTGVDCETQMVATPTQPEPMSLNPILTAGCALNPCLNGGTCFVFNNQLVSEPIELADNNTHHLTAEPMNGEQATDMGGETGGLYRCQCPSAWTGDFCQWPSDMIVMATDTANSSTPTTLAVDLVTSAADKSLDIIATIANQHPTTTTTTTTAAHHLDMKHLISGVVVASVVGVFMAASLLAWCCLIAIERNKFPFIQMNIIRCGADQSDHQGQPEGSVSTFRRFQEKIRNSLRLSSSSSRCRIKPETRLSIENVLRPPPSYEETTKQPIEQPGCTLTIPGQAKLSGSAPTSGQNKPKLVTRGAIEQEMASKQSQRPPPHAASKVASSQVKSECTNTTKTQPDPHSHKEHAQIVNCPRHGPLYISGTNKNKYSSSSKALGDFNDGIEQVKQPTTTIEIEYQPQTVSLAGRQQHEQQIYDLHNNDTTIDILHTHNSTGLARHRHSNQYHRPSQLGPHQQQQQLLLPHLSHLYQYDHSPGHDQQAQPQSICPSLHKSAHDKALAQR